MSTRSTIPFFGRAYALTVTPNQGPSAGQTILISSDALEPEALKVTFDIQQFAYSQFWQAEFVIYNCNGPISSGPSEGVNLYEAVINEGDTVTFAAGYQADYTPPSTPPIVFSGPVFYTIQDRIDVNDQRLILHCLLSRAFTNQNFINETMPALSNQFTQAQFIAQYSTNQIPVDTSQIQTSIQAAQPQRMATNLPRAKSFFGVPHRYLQAIADSNGCLSWFDSKKWNMANLKGVLGPVVGSYAPLTLGGGPPLTINGTKLTLIGQPQQTQLGVNFRILLDPAVQVQAPFAQVSVALRYVRQAPISYPLPADIGPPRPLVNQYVVVGVRIWGDTRGNPWYTDVTGVAQISDAIQLLGTSKQADGTAN